MRPLHCTQLPRRCAAAASRRGSELNPPAEGLQPSEMNDQQARQRIGRPKVARSVRSLLLPPATTLPPAAGRLLFALPRDQPAAPLGLNACRESSEEQEHTSIDEAPNVPAAAQQARALCCFAWQVLALPHNSCSMPTIGSATSTSHCCRERRGRGDDRKGCSARPKSGRGFRRAARCVTQAPESWLSGLPGRGTLLAAPCRPASPPQSLLLTDELRF